MIACGKTAAVMMLAAILAGCTKEARLLASDQPQTPPNGPADPRIDRYEANFYQVSQGGRYFDWYGCAGCHASGATGGGGLIDSPGRPRMTLDRVYAAIATGHAAPPLRYGERIPVEQIWQLAAFVCDLAKNDPTRNRRNALDQQGEPQGTAWQGPIK